MTARWGTRPRHPDRVALVVFVAVVLVGGANFVAMSVNVQELPPFWGAGLRFSVAALLLVGFMRLRGIEAPRGRDLVGAVAFGVLYFGAFYALLYWGLQAVPAGMTSIIVAAAPVLTLVLAVVHTLERLRPRPLLGGLVALSGVVAVFGASVNTGVASSRVLAIVLAALCVSEGAVIAKRFAHAGPIATNAVGMAVGALVLLGFSAIAGETWALPTRPETWATLLYLIPAGTFTLVGVLFLLERWTASATSFVTVLFPVVAVGLDGILGRRSITLPIVFGGLLVMVGVWLGTTVRTG